MPFDTGQLLGLGRDIALILVALWVFKEVRGKGNNNKHRIAWEATVVKELETISRAVTSDSNDRRMITGTLAVVADRLRELPSKLDLLETRGEIRHDLSDKLTPVMTTLESLSGAVESASKETGKLVAIMNELVLRANIKEQLTRGVE